MKFLLFGTGDYYERYKKWFDRNDVLALLDNSPEKQNRMIDGIRVLSPAEGIKLPFDAIVILSFYVKAMRRQLEELGAPGSRIYHFYDLHRLIGGRKSGKPVQYYGGAEKIVKTDTGAGKKVLLLSQDMTLGGPAIALFHAAAILKRHGYQVVYASMLDGPLRDKLTGADIPTAVDVNLQVGTMKDAGWVGRFSLIFCNTVNFHVFLSERDVNIPVIWWLHDSSFFYDGIDREVLRGISRENLKVCSVGPVPADAVRRFIPDMPVGQLLYGVADTAGYGRRKQDRRRRICFVTIGYIEERKGQDILFRAIQALPDGLRKEAVFYLVGQNTSVMAQRLRAETGRMPEVIMTGAMDREGINRILCRADAMVCPSREDPMPTVAAEAMMHGVPCIVSDAAGTAAYIRDGENGFVFCSEDVQGLSAKIEWCIRRRGELPRIGIRSRKIFEDRFSMGVFEKNLLETVGSFPG